MVRPTILTGVRANNDLTLGNYFGGILPIVDMAKTRSSDYQINMFIPDLHSFTTPIDHSKLNEQIFHNARLFVAAGLPLDNENIFLYRQSYIPAHSELAWILDCFTGVGEMSRMTEYKDKAAKTGGDRTTVGLFNYPVLMAADILLYGATYVPVGDDQTQHLEFTRDIAERMNQRFGQIFVVPKPVKEQHGFFGKDQGLRIKDLVDPTKKMSKSDENGRGVIYLTDKPAAAIKKIMGATTDDKSIINFDRVHQPGISNLLEILALLRDEELGRTIAAFENQTRYSDFKLLVAHEVAQFLEQFQSTLNSVNNDEIRRKFSASEQTMNKIAADTLLRVQKALGLRSTDEL